MHTGKRHLVADEVDKPITSSSSSEFVFDNLGERNCDWKDSLIQNCDSNLNGKNIDLSHHVQSFLDEVFIHVAFQPTYPKSTFSTHCLVNLKNETLIMQNTIFFLFQQQLLLVIFQVHYSCMRQACVLSILIHKSRLEINDVTEELIKNVFASCLIFFLFLSIVQDTKVLI